MRRFIAGFFKEGTPESSKRLLSIFSGISLLWGFYYSLLKAITENGRQSLIWSMMVFILLLVGVATVPQIVSLIRGGEPKEEKSEPNN